MRRLRETFGCLLVLCCIGLAECRVLKFVVAVSPHSCYPPPIPAPFCMNKIYPLNARIWISSGSRFRSHKSDVTVRLPLITQRFCARWGLLRSHTYVTKDYFEPLTVPSVSPPDIITLFINLFAYLSFVVVQWWGGARSRTEIKNSVKSFIFVCIFFFSLSCHVHTLLLCVFPELL